MLRLDWKERGGPPLEAEPGRRGFGSRLIAGLGSELHGRASLAFEPDGLRCTVEAPLQEVASEEADG